MNTRTLMQKQEMVARTSNTSILQCDLRNASYSVAFDYRGGAQVVKLRSSIANMNKSIRPIDSVFGPNPNQDPVTNTSGWTGITSMLPVNDTDPTTWPRPVVDPETLQLLSYQAIADAFAALVTGSISLALYTTSPNTTSNLLKTTLARAAELQFLQRVNVEIGSGTAFASLQIASSLSKDTTLNSLFDNTTTSTHTPLGQMIEELFQNVVVSMMSSPQLQPNYHSTFAPARTNVTSYAEHNVYAYAVSRLWLAYGLAIAFSTLAVGLGLLGVNANKGTYTTDFSTILRAVLSGNLRVETITAEQDARGALSPEMGRRKIWVSGPGSGDSEFKEPSTTSKDGTTVMLLDPVDGH
jgi:hypothetical protein